MGGAGVWRAGSAGEGSDLDQVVGEYPVPAPDRGSVPAVQEGAVPAVAAFEVADPAFAAGAPFLRLLEPPLLLFLLAFLTLGGATGNGHSLHAQFFGLGFVGGGEESRVGKRQIRNSTHQLLVFFDRRRQQIGVAGALVEDFAVNDDLPFRMTSVSGSNTLRILLFHGRGASQHALPRLLHQLLYARKRFVELLFGFL